MQVFFNLSNRSDSIRDETGVEAANVESAQWEALAAIGEIRANDPAFSRELEGWQLAAVDQRGRLLFGIDLDDDV
jgi:hypothetical protein